MSSGHRVVVTNLTKRFDKFVALDKVSFAYEGPRAVGYLGPNGAGKTTTLKVLTGLLRPSEGYAEVDGIRVDQDPRAALGLMGGLVETPEPYPQLTGREALEMVAAFRGVPASEVPGRIKTWSERLELPPLERRCGKLSKGQRQRVVLAATLLADPPVVVLDEPTSGLDPAERVRVRNVVLELKKDRLVLMSSHLLGEVTETCDDVIFIGNGKILLQESVAGIEDRIHVRAVEVEFLQPVPSDRMSVLGPLASGVTPLSDRRFRIAFDGNDATRASLLEGCQKVGRVTGFSSVGSALEDVYLQLMQTGTANGGGPPPPGPIPPARAS